MRRSITAAACAAVLAGAVAAAAPARTAPAPRVVVGVMDDPVNPYHAWFHADGPLYAGSRPSSVTPQLLDELGVDEAHRLRLTRTGNWQADHLADRELWAGVNDRELYWFEGTNVLAISFDDGDDINLLPDDDLEYHGSATTAAVLAANPEAVVIVMDPFTSTDGERWMNDYPPVDVISASFGWIAGAPVPFHAIGSYDGVVRNGKLFVGSSGNQPTPDQQSEAGGPWWQIGVSGYHEGSTEGQEILAGVTPDFVGDFRQDLPACGQCADDVEAASGTSFSAPRAAGTISRVLLQARRATGHRGGIVVPADGPPRMVDAGGRTITNWQLRRAVEEAAWVPTTADWQAGGSLPINDTFPWPQVGWGVLTPDPAHDVVGQALAHLGLGGRPTRSKPADACNFMTVNQTARRVYWDFLPTSESFVAADYPYLSC